MSEPVIPTCLNCSAALAGPFCHQCGQKRRSIIHFVDEVVLEVLKNNFGYDSRLWRTIKLLLRPGELAREYVAGKRVSFVSPMRLYLVTSVVFLLVQQVLFRSAMWVAGLGDVAELSGSRILSEAADLFRNGSDLMMRTFLSSLTLWMLPVVPIGAAGLKLLFSKQRRFYMEHLVFLLYAQSMVFLVLLCVRMLPYRFLVVVLPEESIALLIADWVLMITGWGLVYAYGLLAMKLFYGESWRATAVKHFAASIAYGALSVVGLLLPFVWITRSA
jgi:hypothetical protein